MAAEDAEEATSKKNLFYFSTMDSSARRRPTESTEPSSLVVNATLASLPNEVPDSEMAVLASIRPGPVTVAEFARDVLEHNPEDWLLRVCRCSTAVVGEPAGEPAGEPNVVRLAYGGNLETIVYRGNVPLVEDESTIQTIGISLSKGPNRLDPAAPLPTMRPMDSIWDHMMFTYHQQGLEPRALVRVSPNTVWCVGPGEEADDNTHRIRVWPSPDSPFAAVRLQNVVTESLHHVVPASAATAAAEKPKRKRGRKPKAAKATEAEKDEDEINPAARKKAASKPKEVAAVVGAAAAAAVAATDSNDNEEKEPAPAPAKKPARKPTKPTGKSNVTAPSAEESSEDDQTIDSKQGVTKKQRWWNPKVAVWDEPPKGAIKLTFTRDEMDILYSTYTQAALHEKEDQKAERAEKKKGRKEAETPDPSEKKRKVAESQQDATTSTKKTKTKTKTKKKKRMKE